METMTSVTSDLDVDDTTLDTTTHKLKEKVKQWKKVKILHEHLQEGLDTAETEVQILLQKRSSLQEENKSLQKETAEFLDLLEEANKLKKRLEMDKNSEQMAYQGKKQLEKRCVEMEEKADQLLTKIYASELENSSLRKDVTKLEQQFLELESSLDEMSLELNEKENNCQENDSILEEMKVTMDQYISMKEVLSNKIQELQCQLEESYQEIAMRKEIEECDFIESTRASDTIMCEIMQINLEKQLEQAQMKEQGFFHKRAKKRPICMDCSGISGWLATLLDGPVFSMICNMALEFLQCFFCIVIFLLLFFFLMRLFHTLYPDYLLLDLRRVFSEQAIEVIQNILSPFLKLRGVGVPPL
ncbi:uncharacterized protein LOC143817938 [Ranitomeya variabilis]|uniref:uncharacterized protein LOC143817938 n=1 Tax=Ranitomeya variabilis TaxID=490064 RepID=UPI0040577DC2